jgi:hypothetical protein
VKLIARLFAFCSLLAFAVVPAQAQKQQGISANATTITGVYNGTYRCARGPVNLRLTLVAPGDGSLFGVFTFDLPANSSTRTASYTLIGTYDAATGKFRLDPEKWEPPEPANYVMVGMDGAFNSSTEQVSGKITYATCSTFDATRNKAQSAALSHRLAVTPASPAARTAQQPPSSSTTGAARQSGPAQPQQQQGKWFYCYNTVQVPPNSTGKQFVSGVFQSDGEPEAIGLAWDEYIAKTYAPLNKEDLLNRATYHPPHCGTNSKITLQQMHDSDVRGGATAVGWKYVPGQDTPPPPSPSPGGLAGGAVSYCVSDGQAPMYLSDIFGTNKDPKQAHTVDIGSAFNQYLEQKYAYKRTSNTPFGCAAFASRREAELSKQKVEADYQRAKIQMIETGWKWVLPPGATFGANFCYCSGYLGTTPNTLYFSESFWNPFGSDSNKVRDDFVRFIKEKYSPQSHEANGGCAYSAKAEEEGPMRKGGKTIIETGWKPVASGKGDPYYCYGYNANKVLYFSDTFEVPPNTPVDPTREDFAGFVVKKYSLDPGRNGTGLWDGGGAACLWGDKSKHDVYPGYKIIETGWKPKSLPPPSRHQ